ncbi:hypothetical protein TeGR_g14057, partial [Tetraparma gracilis]
MILRSRLLLLPALAVGSQIDCLRAFAPLSAQDWALQWGAAESDPCSLPGVACGAGGEVESLGLSGRGLVGVPDCAWTELVGLQHLDLSNNDIATAVPAGAALPSLKVLDLSWNAIPASLPSPLPFPSLEVLDASFNALSGPLPSFAGAPGIERVDLSYNGDPADLSLGLTGGLAGMDLPATMQHLSLASNRLTGGIGASLDGLVALRHLDVSDNELSSTLPSSLIDLQSLNYVDFSMNGFTGDFPELGMGVTFVAADENQLTGPFPSFLAAAPGLTYVSLSLNYFSGALPSSFASDAITHFDVADAGFEGAVPAEMGEWTSLTFLDLSRNKFEGTVPSAILTMSSVTTIDISDNLLGGALPTTLGAFLRFLNIGGNAFSELPEITYAPNLVSFYFYDNPITSAPPASICDLPSLADSIQNSCFNLSCEPGTMGSEFGRPLGGINACIPCISDADFYANNLMSADVDCQPYYGQSSCPAGCPGNNDADRPLSAPEPAPPIGAIIGGVLGGLVVVAAMAAVVVRRRRGRTGGGAGHRMRSFRTFTGLSSRTDTDTVGVRGQPAAGEMDVYPHMPRASVVRAASPVRPEGVT